MDDQVVMVEIPYFGYTYGMIVDLAERLTALKKIFPFSLLGEEDLRTIAPFFELITFPAEATIYSDGYPANGLFFILSGSVKITLHHKKHDSEMGILHEGDHFGEEALCGEKLYHTRAVGSSSVTVLRLRASKARVIADAYPQIRNAFSLFQKTFKLASTHKLLWRDEKEAVELFSRRHPFFLFLRIFLVGGLTLTVFSFLFFSSLASKSSFILLLILSFISLMIGAALCTWAALEWTNDYFIVTHERVSVQKQLIGFYESRHESPVDAILSVGIDTSIWGRLIGYGTVTVRTYTGDLRFERLPSPYLIYELLENRHQYALIQSEQSDKREIREALTVKKDGFSNKKTLRTPPSALPYNDQIYRSHSFADFLARAYHLRTQQEGSVIYRTHWWIMLRKTFLPDLFLISVGVVILMKFLGFLNGIPAGIIYMGGLISGLFGLGWWSYQYQDWKNDIYILTDDQLIDVNKKPLGNEDRRSAPVKNIQTVEFERKGLANILFNFGTVKIKIGNEELTFDNVYQPSTVQADIYSRYKAFSETIKKNDQQRFVEWIKTYDELKQERKTQIRQPDDEEKG